MPNKTDASNERAVLAISVYQALKEKIMDQVFEPGARLTIEALAAELKVSPTPVREALTRLAAERLVEFISFKGYTVRELLNPHELADLMDVRKLIETYAARLAATRIGLVDLWEMERILKETEGFHPSQRFSEYRVFNQLDQKFHELLVGASGNQTLLETYRSLNLHVQLARFYRNRGEIELIESIAEHCAIYEALKAQNADAAVLAVITHIDNAHIRSVTANQVSTGTKANGKIKKSEE